MPASRNSSKSSLNFPEAAASSPLWPRVAWTTSPADWFRSAAAWFSSLWASWKDLELGGSCKTPNAVLHCLSHHTKFSLNKTNMDPPNIFWLTAMLLKLNWSLLGGRKKPTHFLVFIFFKMLSHSPHFQQTKSMVIYNKNFHLAFTSHWHIFIFPINQKNSISTQAAATYNHINKTSMRYTKLLWGTLLNNNLTHFYVKRHLTESTSSFLLDSPILFKATSTSFCPGRQFTQLFKEWDTAFATCNTKTCKSMPRKA